MKTFVSRHHGLLGTVVELSVRIASEEGARRVAGATIDEMTRLQNLFTLFDDGSELRRWQRGETEPGRELAEVLSLALSWQRSSRGAFNPMAGLLWDLWSAAGAGGQLPAPRAVAAAARAIGVPAYRVDGSVVSVLTDVAAVNLNAIAKGWIIDRAFDVASQEPGVESITLNAGGDVLHRGTTTIVIGIEDPHRPYDNVPPLLRVELRNGALATSGGSRRGFEIAGHQYSHVFDPRTGYPVHEVASASVAAVDAVTADVVSTVLAVLTPAEGLAYASTLEAVACCIIAGNGSIHRTDQWAAIEVR
jgi:thiamine biosynthesis lipoprotein